MISSFDINFITSIVEFIEQKLVSRIAYPYAMNIFSHIYILVKRFREGVVYLEEDTWDLDEEDQALIHYNQELYQLSKQVMLKLGQYLNTTLPESETFYLFQYLISSGSKMVRLNIKISQMKLKKSPVFFCYDEPAHGSGD